MPEATDSPAIEDCTSLTEKAWTDLVAHRADIRSENLKIGRLDAFLAAPIPVPLTIDQRIKILDQAELMLNQLYPHLPFKMDAFQFAHPVEHLEREVRPFLDTLPELEFHGRVIEAFTLVKDAHTLYGLPSPFRGAVAFLPFQMRFYVDDDGQRRYVVSKIMRGFETAPLQPGAEIFKWAGFPVDSFVETIAGLLSGGNADALFSRGTFHMTQRPLTFCQPPGEHELKNTVIEYSPYGGGPRRAILIPWGVATGITRGQNFTTGLSSMNRTQDHAAAWYHCMHCSGAEAKPVDPQAVPPEPKRTPTPAEAELSLPSKVPEAFDVQFTGGPSDGVLDPAVLTTDPPSDARFGYIRIKRFSDGSALGNTGALVGEFRRLLILLDSVAPDGLIIDLRSNPGGDVIAAEQMLQMLTPVEINPSRFHLANTPAILQVLERLSEQRNNRSKLTPKEDVKLTDALVALKSWLPDAGNVPLPHGERLTSGQTLTQKKDANRYGQVYHGRTVLLIDALTYSAAEIFAAGFQDHAIGEIIGMDHNTGGGGANVWTYQDLLTRLGPMTGLKLEPLPSDVTMSLAIRRNSRVGFFPGQFVEDIGVKADWPYVPRSVDDVIFDYPGLVHMACNKIMDMTHFRADPIKAAVNADGSVELDLRLINIDLVDVFLDDVQVLTKKPVTNPSGAVPSTESFHVPAALNNKRPGRIRIEAYARATTPEGDVLLLGAVHRNALPPPPPAPRPPRPAPLATGAVPATK